MNELLLRYIAHDCGHLRERIVTKYGLTYLKLEIKLTICVDGLRQRGTAFDRMDLVHSLKIAIMNSYVVYTYRSTG